MRVSFAVVKDGGFWDEETVDIPDERCGTEADAVHWFVLEHCAEEPNIITAAVLCMPADELDRADDTPPPCAQAMGCLCAAHAKGRASEGPCDANEGCDPESW
jgi:hypothetical protein